jgi:hypothetical protein
MVTDGQPDELGVRDALDGVLERRYLTAEEVDAVSVVRGLLRRLAGAEDSRSGGGNDPFTVTDRIDCPYCHGSRQQFGFRCEACDGKGKRKITVEGEPHGRAWRVPTDDGKDYGVLVECAYPNGVHWYLVCPATATLYLHDTDGTFDLRDCEQGAACDFLDDTHAKAHLLVRELESARSKEAEDA